MDAQTTRTCCPFLIKTKVGSVIVCTSVRSVVMNLWLIFRLRDFISNETINNYVYCMYMRELHIYNCLHNFQIYIQYVHLLHVLHCGSILYCTYCYRSDKPVGLKIIWIEANSITDKSTTTTCRTYNYRRPPPK